MKEYKKKLDAYNANQEGKKKQEAFSPQCGQVESHLQGLSA
jgi:hypothetical protein